MRLFWVADGTAVSTDYKVTQSLWVQELWSAKIQFSSIRNVNKICQNLAENFSRFNNTLPEIVQKFLLLIG